MTKSQILSNKELLLNRLIELTNVEFNNLCEISSKSQIKLMRKAYKRTNSLRKIKKLAMKYQLFLPHEEFVPTIIPFYFKKAQTNPSTSMRIRARNYLEAYGFVKEAIKDRLSTVEVESCFKEYTFDYFTKNTLK